jgi:hypothetical protein
MTKEELITQFKSDYPTLKTGDDENGYINLSAKEYEEIISSWADVELAKIEAIAEAEANAIAKAALLDRLAITADEAKLLLS